MFPAFIFFILLSNFVSLPKSLDKVGQKENKDIKLKKTQLH